MEQQWTDRKRNLQKFQELANERELIDAEDVRSKRKATDAQIAAIQEKCRSDALLKQHEGRRQEIEHEMEVSCAIVYLGTVLTIITGYMSSSEADFL